MFIMELSYFIFRLLFFEKKKYKKKNIHLLVIQTKPYFIFFSSITTKCLMRFFY